MQHAHRMQVVHAPGDVQQRAVDGFLQRSHTWISRCCWENKRSRIRRSAMHQRAPTRSGSLVPRSLNLPLTTAFSSVPARTRSSSLFDSAF